MTLKKADFSKICRMCLLIKKEMLTIQIPEIIEMIINCIGIEVKLNDGLPQSICFDCSTQIHQYSEFRKQCKNADKVLHKIVNGNDNFDSLSDENDNVGSSNIKNEFSNDVKEESFEAETNRTNVSYSYNNDENTLTNNVIDTIKSVFIKNEVEESENGKLLKVESLEAHVLEENKNYVKDENFHSKFSSSTDDSDNFLDSKADSETELTDSNISNKKNKKVLKKLKKKQTCDQCFRTFRKPCELAKHLSDVHNRKKTLECSVCSKTFHLQVQLDLHLKLHFKTKHICNICGKEFAESSKLKRHQKIHKTREQVFCVHCNKSFLTDDSYRRHVKAYHTESGAIVKKMCPICGKAVIDVDLHINHTHNKNKPYKCDQCGKSFGFNHLLTNHVEEKHLGIKRELKALCFICGKACLNQGELKKHMPMHAENREFECELCKKKYKSRNGLLRHSKKHKNIRPYECSLCSKKYLEKAHLEQHFNSHTGQRPFACHICGRTFSYKGAKWKHMKVHNVVTESNKNTNIVESNKNANESIQ